MTWWIATVAPSLEFRAAHDVAGLGLDVWLPCHDVQINNRRGTRKTITRSYPTFPRYLFVKAFSSDWRDDWQAIRSARDVSGILANAGLPLSLTDASLDMLRRRLDAPVMRPVEAAYRVGEHIRIVDQGSPFCGIEGQVEACDRQTVRLLLDILGRKTRVEILGDRLERVA